MNKTNALGTGLMMIAVIGITGCASTSTQTAAQQPKAKPEVIFEQPIEKTQRAAVDALTVVGCDIKKQEREWVGRGRHQIVKSGGDGVENQLVANEATVDEQEYRIAVELLYLGTGDETP